MCNEVIEEKSVLFKIFHSREVKDNPERGKTSDAYSTFGIFMSDIRIQIISLGLPCLHAVPFGRCGRS